MKDNNNSLAVPNLHIPPEAVEAAHDMCLHMGWRPHPEMLKLAIRAALENWTGVLSANKHNGIFVGCSALILPLTENPDADA